MCVHNLVLDGELEPCFAQISISIRVCWRARKILVPSRALPSIPRHIHFVKSRPISMLFKVGGKMVEFDCGLRTVKRVPNFILAGVRIWACKNFQPTLSLPLRLWLLKRFPTPNEQERFPKLPGSVVLKSVLTLPGWWSLNRRSLMKENF